MIDMVCQIIYGLMIYSNKMAMCVHQKVVAVPNAKFHIKRLFNEEHGELQLAKLKNFFAYVSLALIPK